MSMHPNTMKNYCPDLYYGLYLEKFDQNQTKICNCCLQPRNGPVDHLTFDHNYLERDRQYLETTGELPPSCKLCTDAEEIGIISKRINLIHQRDYNNMHYDTTPILQDLNYNCDNICNIKCITCDSSNSSAWIEDEVKMGKRKEFKIKHTKHNDLTFDLDLSQLRLVVFNGGEPLMTMDHFKVLDYIISQGKAGGVVLNYNTNATFPITDQMRDYWKQFYHVQLQSSIDGTGESFYYSRFPAKWEEVTKNLLQYKSEVTLSFSTSMAVTVGVHNILYIDDILNWANTHGFAVAFNANAQGMLNLKNFPPAHKEYLLDYLRNLPDYLKIPGGSVTDIRVALTKIVETLVSLDNTDTEWIQYLDQMDGIRNTKWRTSLSRLYQLDTVYFDSISRLGQ
jgi:MoaA/NifB/PqqE/SkfB family radical SAM enzyme